MAINKNLSLLSLGRKGKLFALTVTPYLSLCGSLCGKGLIALLPIFTRVISILLLISGLLLIYNILYIQSVGFEVGVYSDFYQVTVLSSSFFSIYPNKSKISIKIKFIKVFVYKF